MPSVRSSRSYYISVSDTTQCRSPLKPLGSTICIRPQFKRRIKTQTVLPCAETAAMLFWALLASGQIIMRKVDGWESLTEKPSDQLIDLAA